jgi:hypothetical protein
VAHVSRLEYRCTLARGVRRSYRDRRFALRFGASLFRNAFFRAAVRLEVCLPLLAVRRPPIVRFTARPSVFLTPGADCATCVRPAWRAFVVEVSTTPAAA